uniref:Uncharacterized protein n=1 Tax=Setaria viridis TaxID=4556 RepID=A0A4U6WEW5_SETVI|nr:hypothetical protein SEVIR_1G234500v2 [Setaria viridis]
MLAGNFWRSAGDGAVPGLKAREVIVTSHPRTTFFAPLLPCVPSPLSPPVRPQFASGLRYPAPPCAPTGAATVHLPLLLQCFIPSPPLICRFVFFWLVSMNPKLFFC